LQLLLVEERAKRRKIGVEGFAASGFFSNPFEARKEKYWMKNAQ
jgi:hypothetical protein